MSKTFAKAIAGLASALTCWQRPMRQANTLLRVSNLLQRRHSVQTNAGPVHFLSTHPQALDYPSSLLTREPDTITWLDQLSADSVLWDIGANVGAYALYAARRGATVWAFEPAPASFAALSENVRINRLDDHISALPLAVAGKNGIDYLAMASTNPGSVMHSVGAEAPFRQSVLCVTVDDFIRSSGAPAPTHIKLDVDGIEPDILEGALATLAAPSFQSLLVEMDAEDTPRNATIVAILGRAGLKLIQMGPISHQSRNGIFARA
ncbi:FkbM family methyltransferase [Magnetospirillum sulfuroxidans]|uniref:FkbM family methyltransferase n=1 Tax=Magnetospirillum sulfuroxidans TaxID=611300 RepID=A0ABS5I767_9PROT|nr:FkbM family methyltransferase [Magnetospirillum sulfuroxidans]MBR9970258.1 FkbM family methyltransferase [Magnetospirillum sulfuroxidans]